MWGYFLASSFYCIHVLHIFYWIYWGALVNKIHRFQVSNSITHHLNIILWVHHPKPRLLLSPFLPPLMLPFPLAITTLLSTWVSLFLSLFLNLLNPFYIGTFYGINVKNLTKKKYDLILVVNIFLDFDSPFVYVTCMFVMQTPFPNFW